MAVDLNADVGEGFADDGRLVMAGPGRPENRFRPAQGRISGVLEETVEDHGGD